MGRGCRQDCTEKILVRVDFVAMVVIAVGTIGILPP